MSTVTLPGTITIGNHKIALNWTENNNLDGFIAEVKSGIPVENFASSEDCERAIWDADAIKSDVYLDGSGVFYIKAF